MSRRLVDMEGVGPTHAATLANLGITSTDDLLSRGARPDGRAALAEQSGISAKLILEWVNHADLFRIRGVAGQYADLLEASGVDTVVELARRNPENLAARLAEVNATRNLTNRLPTSTEVADWVAQARDLPRAVFYEDGSTSEPSTGAPSTGAPSTAAPGALADTSPAPVAAEAPAPAAPAVPPVPPLNRESIVAPAATTVAPAGTMPATTSERGAAAGTTPATTSEWGAGGTRPEPRPPVARSITPQDRGWLERLVDWIRGR